jgi:SAM-dependent methyltransferase
VAAEVAAALGVGREFDQCLLRVGATTLHLLRGVTRAGADAVDVSPEALWAIVRPDLVTTTSGEEFARRVLECVAVPDDDTFLRAVSAWWSVYRLAAPRLFEDESRLAAYFADPCTCPGWWNQRSTAAASHRAYASLLSSRISTRGKDVLDAGCGFGRLGLLYDGARRVVALDLSEEMIRRARTAPDRGNVTFRVQDLSSVGELGAFETVLALQVLMHASSLSRGLDALAAATRPGGEVWLDFTCVDRPCSEGFVQETFFTRLYTERHLLRACARSGLTVRSATRFPCEDGKYWLLVHAVPSARGLRGRRARPRSAETVSALRG